MTAFYSDRRAVLAYQVDTEGKVNGVEYYPGDYMVRIAEDDDYGPVDRETFERLYQFACSGQGELEGKGLYFPKEQEDL